MEFVKHGIKVDAGFIKNDEHTKKIEKLQEIIYFLEEKNFQESVSEIIKFGFTSDDLINDLARNIIHFSSIHKSKVPLFTRLVSE